MINTIGDLILIVIHRFDWRHLRMQVKFSFLFLVAGLPVMHISQGVKREERQSSCVLTELSSSVSTLKILKRKKGMNERQEEFQFFPSLVSCSFFFRDIFQLLIMISP